MAVEGSYYGLDVATLTTMKSNLIAALTALATGGQSYTISGRTFTRIDLAKTRAELAEVQSALDRLAGNRTTRTFPIFSPSDFIGGSGSSGSSVSLVVYQNANLLYAGPISGSAAPPTFRALVGADFPALMVPIGSINATGTASGATYLRGDGTWATFTTGTVTSVGLSLPSFITVTGSPVTSSGTLTGALATQSPNLFFSGPSTGSAAAPTFRALVNADFPSTLTPTVSTLTLGGGSLTGGAAGLTINSGGTNQNVTLAPSGTGITTTASPVNITNTTNAISYTTGAMQVAGGASFKGSIYALNIYAYNTTPPPTYTSGNLGLASVTAVNRPADGYQTGFLNYASGQNSGVTLSSPIAGTGYVAAGATVWNFNYASGNGFNVVETGACVLALEHGLFRFLGGTGLTVGLNVTLAEYARFTVARNFLIGGTTDIPGSGGLKIYGATDSTSPTTGALQVVGGAGILLNLNVAGSVTVGGGSPVKCIRTAIATLAFPTIPANGGTQSLTVTITGVSVSDTVIVNRADGSMTDNGTLLDGTVTAANTVTVRDTNNNPTTVSPISTTYRITVISY